jgi:hypothetical protein
MPDTTRRESFMLPNHISRTASQAGIVSTTTMLSKPQCNASPSASATSGTIHALLQHSCRNSFTTAYISVISRKDTIIRAKFIREQLFQQWNTRPIDREYLMGLDLISYSKPSYRVNDNEVFSWLQLPQAIFTPFV